MNVRTIKTAAFKAGAALGLAAALLAAPAQANNYAITDLGTLGGSTSSAQGLNNSGYVVGSAANGWGTTEGFIGGRGWISAINSPASGQSCYANAINDYEVVAGNAYDGSGNSRGFVYYQGQQWDIGTLGGATCSALAVNTSGTIVGSSTNSAGWGLAYVWNTAYGMRSLGTLGGYTSSAQGINDSGTIVGIALISGGFEHAFLWQNGAMHDLGTLGGAWSSALAINNAGQVVGWSNTSAGPYARHGFVWQNGWMRDLGSPAGNSAAASINSSGVIVGTVGSHAGVYAGGSWSDLNSCIGSGTGWTLLSASHVNDAGQIVGTGTVNGQRHAFLLIPH